MHLSGDAKDLLYKCTILTAMMRRLTRVLFCHSFRKLTFQVNKINHKKRCKARDVSNAQTELSLRHSHVLHVYVQPNVLPGRVAQSVGT